MSDGLYRMAGTGMPVKIGDKEYQVSTRITVGMRAEIEVEILKRRPDFMEKVGKSLEHFPEKYRAQVIKDAVAQCSRANTVTNEDVEVFLSGSNGAAFLFWILVREKQPEVNSLETAKTILAEAEVDISDPQALAELQQQLDRAAGLSDLKN